MGKSAVDLPDPLHQQEQDSAQSATGTDPDAASADDLLAKLADSEIDRLLAEAEVPRGRPDPEEVVAVVNAPVEPIAFDGAHPAPPASTTDQKATQTSPIVAEKPADSESEELEEEAKAEAVEAAPGNEAEESQSAESSVSQQLDQLFTQLDDEGSAPQEAATSSPASASAAGSTTAPAADMQSSPVTSASAPVAAPGAESTPATEAKRDAVVQPQPKEVTAGASEKNDGVIKQKAERVPLLLRPLVWINAPFVSCSITVRETLGKVAIITLVNALAVLLYVLIFR